MKDQQPRTLSRRDVLKLGLAGGAGLLTACTPEPIRTILTSTPTATGTRFPTNTPFPSETATFDPSETPKPTDTPSPSDTPKPTETPVPEVDILTKLAEKGVVFPEDTSSHLETDDYTYDFRLSRGILANSGLQYVKIPERILKNMAEQAWGRFIFMQRDYINRVAPHRLAPYSQTLESIEQAIYSGDPLYALNEFIGKKIFIELAQGVMKDGPVPFLLNNDHINGEVDQLEMNFVSKDEFQEVTNVFDQERVRYLLRPEWVRQNTAADNFDTESAIFIKDRKLVIYLYQWGWPDSNYASNPRQYGKYPPMERMPRSLDRGVYYMELGSLWDSGVMHLQIRLQQPRDGQNAPRDVVLTYFPKQDLMCIEDDGTFGYTIGSIANCRDEIDETFSPQR